jgi:hypothetical protein
MSIECAVPCCPGITIANPTDVVKVRLQAEGRLPPGAVRQYSGAFDAYKKIIAKDGITGLWRGYSVNVVRNSVINAAELASYDQCKQTVLHYRNGKDDVATHLISGAMAGFVATLIGSPVDVLKTRVMNTQNGVPVYSGIMDCLTRSIRNDGYAFNLTRTLNWFCKNIWNVGFRDDWLSFHLSVDWLLALCFLVVVAVVGGGLSLVLCSIGVFYKGFWTLFARIGSWNVVMFLSYEQIKKQVAAYQKD